MRWFVIFSLSLAMVSSALASAPALDAPTVFSDLSAVGLAVSDAIPTEGDEVTFTLEVAGTPLAETTEPFRGIVIEAQSPLSGRGAICPCVLGTPETGYTMWYVGISDDNVRRILRATSPDGIAWIDHGVSLERPYPNECIYPWVVDNGDGTLTMWFTNLNYRYTIMRATSTDGGASWSEPILEMTYGQWYDLDGSYCARVLFDGSQWRMWYTGIVWQTSTTPAYTRICAAHKASFSDAWIKDGVAIDCTPATTHMKEPWVLATDAGYEMYYAAAVTQKIDGLYRIVYCEIRHASSADGRSWATDPAPYLAPELPEEGVAVHQPSVLRFPDGDRMWYTGYIGYDAVQRQRIMYAGTRTAVQAVDATCSVSFFVDGACVGTVAGLSVPSGGTAVASVGWIAVAGEHAVFAEIHSASPEDADASDNAAQMTLRVAPALPPGAAVLGLSKERTSGPETGFTHTYFEWTLLITVTNDGDAQMTGILVRDVLPTELGLLFCGADAGAVTVNGEPVSVTKRAPFVFEPAVDSGLGTAPAAAPAPPTLLPVKSTHIEWRIDALAPGESAHLTMTIFTRVNPGGNQEFTSPGTYLLNEGASATADGALSAGPTPPITFLAIEKISRPSSLTAF